MHIKLNTKYNQINFTSTFNLIYSEGTHAHICHIDICMYICMYFINNQLID